MGHRENPKVSRQDADAAGLGTLLTLPGEAEGSDLGPHFENLLRSNLPLYQWGN